MTDEEAMALRAQLSALTFLTEVLLANLIASNPTEETARRFISDLRIVSGRIDGYDAQDEQVAAQIADEMSEIQERIAHILDRAIERAGRNP